MIEVSTIIRCTIKKFNEINVINKNKRKL